jgi:hypothetical protein
MIINIYFACLLLILIWEIFFRLITEKSKDIYVAGFSFLLLFFISILRNQVVGTDLNAYLPLYDNISTDSWDYIFYRRYEPGYILFNKLLSYISLDNRILIVAISFFVIFIFIKFILKYSPIPWLSIFLFVSLGHYVSTFNILRQWMAIAITLIAIHYLVNHKNIKFVIGILTAALFHYTALSLLVLLFICKVKLIWRYYFAIIFVSIISVYLFGEKIMQYFLLLRISDAYEYAMTEGEGFSLFFLLLFLSFIGFIFKNKVLKMNPNYSIFYHIVIFAVCFQILAVYFSLFTRVALYFYVFLIVYLPIIVSSIQEKKFRRIAIVSIVLLSPIMLYIALKSNTAGIFPYLFMWE